jgi:hypothetical protein
MFWRAAFLLPLAKASLRWRGYNETYASLERRLEATARTAAGSSDRTEETGRICRMVGAAERRSPGKFTCLEESLVLWYLLRWQGIAARLRIGVRKISEKFEAHAWVEYNGEALNQPEQLHRHYAAFEQEIAEPPAEPS